MSTSDSESSVSISSNLDNLNLGFTNEDFTMTASDDEEEIGVSNVLPDSVLATEAPIRVSKAKAVVSIEKVREIEALPRDEFTRIANSPSHPQFNEVREVFGRIRGGATEPKKRGGGGGRAYKSKARSKLELLISNIKDHRLRGVSDEVLRKAINANLADVSYGQCVTALDAIADKTRLKIVPVDGRYSDSILHYTTIEINTLESDFLDIEREKSELELKLAELGATLDIINNEIHRRSSDGPTIKFIKNVLLQMEMQKLEHDI